MDGQNTGAQPGDVPVDAADPGGNVGGEPTGWEEVRRVYENTLRLGAEIPGGWGGNIGYLPPLDAIHLYGDAFSINGRMVHGAFDSSIGADNELETASIQFSRQELSEVGIDIVERIEVLFSAYWDSGQEAFSLANFIVGSEEATSSEVPSRAEAIYNSSQLVICPGEDTSRGIHLQLANNASYPIFVTIDAVSETVSSQRIAIRDPGQFILPGAMAHFDEEIPRESVVDAGYSESPREFFIHGTLSASLTSEVSFTTAIYQP